MKRYLIFLLSLFSGIIFYPGCKKTGPCFTSTGKVVREVRYQNGDFDTIDVNNYVNLILTQDTVRKVEVEAGQNIISGITTEISNRHLIVDNTLNCNWLRSYNTPIKVYISVVNLGKIYYLSSGNIRSTNTIRSGNLIVDIWGGSGSIDLTINTYQAFFILHMGTVDVTLHGHCDVNSIYAGDFGFFQCKDLTTGYSYITNNGSNDCYVNVSMFFQATIGSIGNIYYTGKPDTLLTNITGTGKLIHFDQ
jgi:hypothetical protein